MRDEDLKRVPRFRRGRGREVRETWRGDRERLSEEVV